MPFHVWLPLAHPAAPSHVSALMSGIMIKMGIYGIFRMLTLLMPFHGWWGGLVIAIGAVSGILGILFAIGQSDLKRLLAYSSVENIGIIMLGIGLGIIGCADGCGPMAVFGFAGALLHVINHSFFKTTLFLGAGAILRQTGTADIDRLGGLVRNMPQTAAIVLAGAAAICGLPFFNGFISEIMLYRGGIHAAIHGLHPSISLGGVTAVLALAAIGGLAIACFTKVIGIIFLGEPRTPCPSAIREVPWQMTAAMWFTVAICAVLGFASPLLARGIVPVLAQLLPAGAEFDPNAPAAFSAMTTVALVCCGVLMLCVFAAIRFIGNRRTAPSRTVTWDCGYARPDATMQYTGSSFATPLIAFFNKAVGARRVFTGTTELFPGRRWSMSAHVDDWFLSKIFIPATGIGNRALSLLHWFQNGKSGQYVLYIAITVAGIIIWKFFL
jgi:hydrogenase-4 component B